MDNEQREAGYMRQRPVYSSSGQDRRLKHKAGRAQARGGFHIHVPGQRCTSCFPGRRPKRPDVAARPARLFFPRALQNLELPRDR